MTVGLFKTSDEREAEEILSIKNEGEKNIVTYSKSKQLEEKIKNSKIVNFDKKSVLFFNDGLSFLRALLFHYRTVYLYATEIQE